MQVFSRFVLELTLPFGLGARWLAYPRDQAIELGLILLAVGAGLVYVAAVMGGKTFRFNHRIGGLAGVFVVITWACAALVAINFFDTLGKGGFLVQSPVWPVTLASAGVTFFAILGSAFLRNRGRPWAAIGSGFVGGVVGVMVFELPYLFLIAPRLGQSFVDSLWTVTPLFVLCFASYSLVFLSPLAGFSRYTLLSLGAMFVAFSLWAFLTNFAFPSGSTSLWLNSASKVLGFVVAFTLFFHKREQ